MGKDVLGTAEAAKFCRCSTRLVCRWIDQRILAGFRLPGSRTRRVPRAALVSFMRAHNMPAAWIAEAEEK